MANEKQVKQEQKFEVQQVATQTAEVLVSTSDGKQITITEALVLLLNKVEHLEQLLER